MKDSKAYVIPCTCLPLELRHGEKNLVLRTAIGCKIASVMAGDSVVALVVEDDGLGRLRKRIEAAVAVKPQLFKADKLKEDASWDDFNRYYPEYNKRYNQWEKDNLTIVAVQEKLKEAGLRFTREDFFEGYN